MKKGRQEIVWLFLKVSLLVAIFGISSKEVSFSAEAAENQDEPDNQNGDRLNLKERMSKLETENRQQKQELAVMKTTLDENRKEMENMKGRVSLLEQSEGTETQERDQNDLLSRPKRPYRLIPPKLSRYYSICSLQVLSRMARTNL